MLVITLGISGAVAAISYQQTLTIQGTTKYPLNTHTLPTPTVTGSSVTPGPTSTVKFSLFYPDGSSCPSTLTNPNFVVVGRSLDDLKNIGHPPDLILKNQGSTPITVTASLEKMQAPSNVAWQMICVVTGTDGTSFTGSIVAGQSVGLMLIVFLYPTDYNFASNQALAYSFDVVVTATQA